MTRKILPARRQSCVFTTSLCSLTPHQNHSKYIQVHFHFVCSEQTLQIVPGTPRCSFCTVGFTHNCVPLSIQSRCNVFRFRLSHFKVFISFLRMVNFPKTHECIAASKHDEISANFVGLVKTKYCKVTFTACLLSLTGHSLFSTDFYKFSAFLW